MSPGSFQVFMDGYIKLLKVVSAIFLLVCFISLKERFCKTMKIVFYFKVKSFSLLHKNSPLNLRKKLAKMQQPLRLSPLVVEHNVVVMTVGS